MVAYAQHKFLPLNPYGILDGAQRGSLLELIMYGGSDCNREPGKPSIKFCLYMVGQSDHIDNARVGQIYLVADITRDPGQMNHEADDGTMWWFEHLWHSVLWFHDHAY
jgi:hypothetical protein